MDAQLPVLGDRYRSANKMKLSLLLLLVLALGCDRSKNGTFTVESQTGERFGRNMNPTEKMEFMSATGVNSLVSAIDWSTGKTRAHVSIVSFGNDEDNTTLSIQHDLKAARVHITAIWNPSEDQSSQVTTLQDQDSVVYIVKAYTSGENLGKKADWRDF